MNPFRRAFLLIVISVIIPSISQAFPIPDTGQTKCYNATGEISCPNPGEGFYGQDAQYQGAPRSYTKLGAGGVELPDTATQAEGWMMTRDDVTGLIWEIKTDDESIHDKDNEYTWYDSNTATNGGNEGTAGDGSDTEDFIAELNAANYGGFSDWRLPTVKELSSLVDASKDWPAVDMMWFPLTVSNAYWSSTTNASNASSAWQVQFSYGHYSLNYKSDTNFVRAVRSGQSEEIAALKDNGDGTVTDMRTGLMWQKTTAPGTYTWQEALSYAEGLAMANHSDWRLPDRNELQTLVDYSRFSPAVHPLLASDTVWDYHWSSTTSGINAGDAWLVTYSKGGITNYGKSNSYYVRVVRKPTEIELAYSIPDAIFALKTVAAMVTDQSVGVPADVTGDGRIGIGEAIYALQKTAGLHLSPATQNDLLSGPYIAIQLGVDPNHWTTKMSVSFDGVGSFTYQQISGSNGDVYNGSGIYSVSADGALSINGEIAGIVDPSGNLFSTVDANGTDGDLSIQLGVKKSTGMSSADLNGAYVMSEIGVDPNHWTGRILLNFDGTGGVTWQQLADSNNDGMQSGTGTYAVAGDGSLSVNGETVGIVAPDGNVFVNVDTDSADDDLSIHVGVKQAWNMSTAKLAGSFIMCEIGEDPNHWTGRIRLTFDGAGGVTWTQLTDSNGDGTSSGTGTYSVSADGTLSVGGVVSGNVSPDGNFFTIVDADSSDGDLSIHIGIKTHDAASADLVVPGYWDLYVPSVSADKLDGYYFETIGAQLNGASLLGVPLNGSASGTSVQFSDANGASFQGTWNGQAIVGTFNHPQQGQFDARLSPAKFHLTGLSPGQTLQTTLPVFSWITDEQADQYFILVMKDNDEGTCHDSGSCTGIWEKGEITGTEVTFNNDGTATEALLPGGTYRLRVYSRLSSQTGTPNSSDPNTYVNHTMDVLFRIGSSGSYSDASLNGPWFMSNAGDDIDFYMDFNGAGGITAAGVFFTPGGTYEVNAGGDISLSITDAPMFVGQMTASTSATITNLGTLSKITDTTLCEGTWTGALITGGGDTYSINLVADSFGNLTSLTGFASPFSGKMYSISGRIAAHFYTGEPESDPFNQINLNGTLSGNTISGTFEIDNGSGTDGTFTLNRQ